MPVQDVDAFLYGMAGDEVQANGAERKVWRRQSQLMSLLSEQNVQRIRQMFDEKGDGGGLSLSEFLYVLQQALVRWPVGRVDFRTPPQGAHRLAVRRACW